MTLWMHCFETNNKNPHLCFYLQFAVPLNNNNCCYLDHKPLLLALVRCLSRKPRELHCCSRDLSRNYCLHNYSTNSRHILLIFVSWYLIAPVQVVEYKSIRMGSHQSLPSDPLLKKKKINYNIFVAQIYNSFHCLCSNLTATRLVIESISISNGPVHSCLLSTLAYDGPRLKVTLFSYKPSCFHVKIVLLPC